MNKTFTNNKYTLIHIGDLPVQMSKRTGPMKLNLIATILLLILVTGCIKFEKKQANNNQKTEQNMDNEKPRVTGVGGIFFKSDNPDELKTWYEKNLGLNTDQWGTNFEWYQGRDSSKKGFTQWSPFPKKQGILSLLIRTL